MVNKSIRFGSAESRSFNTRCGFCNLTNTRNLDIPEARINNAGFLNPGNTDGGKRRIAGTLRFVF